MHAVLQTHYQIQRRSSMEKSITVASLACLSLFLAINLYLHSTLDDWRVRDEQANSTTTDAIERQKNAMHNPERQLDRRKREALHKGPKQDLRYEMPSEPTARQQFEREHENLTVEELVEFAQTLRKPDPASFSSYDIFNCPPSPVKGYPEAWNALSVLEHWNPDTTTMPSQLHQGLCVFDWRRLEHRKAVETYREAELPFICQYHPDILPTVRRWSSSEYIDGLLGNSEQRNEYSQNNHFMFWRLSAAAQRHLPKGWAAPTENVQLTYADWLQHATEIETLSDEEQVTAQHWYFRLNAGLPAQNTYLYDELPIFQPRDDPALFMVDSSAQRGINCRFGMKGVIAESHFDPTRNWIVLLNGQRRYILAHPNQCRNMELYPREHPSGRHSAVDWSNVSQNHKGPFRKARVNEVVLQAGDALYLPSSWFHFIVSLNTNYQCNARSGATNENAHHIERCGFSVG